MRRMKGIKSKKGLMMEVDAKHGAAVVESLRRVKCTKKYSPPRLSCSCVDGHTRSTASQSRPVVVRRRDTASE